MILLRNTILISLALALPLAAALGDLAPSLSAFAVCPEAFSRLQFSSTTSHDKTREMNASTYCVDPDTWEACAGKQGTCRRQPVSAALAYGGIFVVGWIAALAPAFGIALFRHRKKKTKSADPRPR